ncbi:hypothetical protein M655_024845 [Brevibacillus sp. NSP2.1]|uniref:hypothetical protein n=1 Tax=Brevibacillus TaxID=55080 RepID=UPI00040B92BC|nr:MULTISPECIES: hypothetical protein [Brevibacillus]QHZ58602.1 hypothetical protein M655_024845 [Brevibacillus sp. NSP2.1]
MTVTKSIKFRFPMDIQYFAEDSETSAETVNTETQTETTEKPEIMIPKTRFDEVNTKFKDVQRQLEELLKEKQDREKAEAEKRGEYERLYQDTTKQAEEFKTKAETTEQRVQQLESVISQLLDAKLENIPEDFRDLIPANFTVEQKLEWIATAEKKGLFAKKPQQQIGDDTNAPDKQKVDLNSLNPMQLFMAGYGSK